MSVLLCGIDKYLFSSGGSGEEAVYYIGLAVAVVAACRYQVGIHP